MIELLVVLVIFTVVCATATRLMMASTVVFTRESANLRIAQDLAAAKNIFLDDMSIAGYLATPSTTFESVTTGTNSDAVTFLGDIDSSGGLPDRICYRLSGSSLQRQVVLGGASAPGACGNGSYETLVDNVTRFSVTFLDTTRAAISSANVANILNGTANERYVQLTLTINSQTNGITAPKTIQGEVALRNY